jgi:hypothetical protein
MIAWMLDDALEATALLNSPPTLGLGIVEFESVVAL